MQPATPAYAHAHAARTVTRGGLGFGLRTRQGFQRG